MSGHQHLAPHLTLVFLGRGGAGQTEELVKNLVSGEKSPFKNCVDSGQRRKRRGTDLQHELHADPVFYQSHHQVSFTLEHLVVLPGQRVGVLDGEVKVRGGAEETQHVLPSQHYNKDERSF